MPKISVIIPTYNRAHLIGATIESVLAQSLVDFELIVVDDGSTDDTQTLVRRCFSDRRLVYVYQKNAGGSAARNLGRQKSHARYLLFLDSDDLLLPGALQAFWGMVESYPDIGVIGGGYQYIDQNGELLGESCFWEPDERLTLDRWLFTCPFIPSASLIRIDCFDKVGGFDTDQLAAQDWDLWLRLSLVGCSMAWLKQPVCQYRLHSRNLSGDFRRHHAARGRALDKVYAQSGLPPAVTALRSQAYAHSYLKLIIQEYAAQQFESACENLRRAVAIAPEILDDDAQVIFEKIISFARRPLETKPLEYVEGAFDHLPVELTALRRRRREALGTVAMALVFSAAQQQEWSIVRRYWWRGVCYQPKWLGNFGVWSILSSATIKIVFRRWLGFLAIYA